MFEVRPLAAALRHAICLCVGAGLTAAAPLQAAAQPVLGESSEQQVNSFTGDDQLQADIAATSDGRMIVVWTSRGSDAGDSDGTSVQAQLYRSDGLPSGAEFQVNGYTTSDQFLPSVAMTEAGDFLVVWMSDGNASGDVDETSIQAQRYAEDGTATDGQFQVNATTTGKQYYPSAAVDDSGAFMVVWDSAAGDGDGYGIRGRACCENMPAAPSGSEFTVNSYVTGNQFRPTVSSDGSDFVVVWHSESSAEPDEMNSVQGQRVDPAGAAIGSQFHVNTSTLGQQQNAQVANAPDGTFIVVWESEESQYPLQSSLDDRAFSIQAQRYEMNGTEIGGEFQVNTHTPTGQRYPTVTFDVDSNFAVAWDSSSSSGDDNSLYSIQARRFEKTEPSKIAPDGFAPDGNDFQVNTLTTLGQSLPTIARRLDGDFVVAWQSRRSLGSDSSGYSVQLAPAPGAAALQLASLAGLVLLARIRRG